MILLVTPIILLISMILYVLWIINEKVVNLILCICTISALTISIIVYDFLLGALILLSFIFFISEFHLTNKYLMMIPISLSMSLTVILTYNVGRLYLRGDILFNYILIVILVYMTFIPYFYKKFKEKVSIRGKV